IHRQSFDKLKRVIDDAARDEQLTLLAGGRYDDSTGFFVAPTIYQASDPDHAIFNTEFFGPILAVYVYDDARFDDMIAQADRSGGGYALTGSVFATDRAVLRRAEE